MVFYPIQILVDADIRDIIIVTGGQNSGDFLRLLSNGKDFNLHRIHHTYQEGEGGIADALRLAEPFVEGEKICVVLHIILKKVPDPKRFGCPEIVNGQILGIEEKPKKPKSDYAVTGIYFYDQSVFEKIGKTKPSWRNELEITDVNNMYLMESTLTHSILDGWWTDAGTFESLLRATNMVAESGANKIPGRGAPPRHARDGE